MSNEIIFPKNRKEVFLVLIKYHKFDLLKINLLIAGFALLSLLVIYFGLFIIGQVPSLISNGTLPMAKEGDMDYSILFTSLTYLVFMFIILIFTNIPLFLGLGGGIYVISQLCYAEANLLIGKDFFIGIKRNAKHMILLSLLYSVAALFMVFIFSVYLVMDTYLAIKIISNIIGVLVFLVVNIVIFIAINYTNTYEVKYFDLLKSSFLIAFSKPFRSVAFALLSCIFFYLLIIPMRIPVFPLLVFFFGFSYYLVIEFLYTSSLFDKYINEKAHEEIVDKGMKKDD